ncbi:hypothetical protein [Acidipila sp. EB88]|uniref:MutS-related protein n=1 Tax=Acidipila sp. EB88 TaxID=2305226 RepID=UPI000F5DC268|nr:hypothetical protein [Acidipila sp. EB88]RRA49221.1 hypothetical protein D1Y84_14015 [Acidipila sp. EB88]
MRNANQLAKAVITVEIMSNGKPVLFLIDEIVSGTNSQDRRAAAEIIIQALLAAGAIGALSTHDLSLTELAANPETNAGLVHMGNQDADRPLEFDYRLRPGVASQANALALVRMVGITKLHADRELCAGSMGDNVSPERQKGCRQ